MWCFLEWQGKGEWCGRGHSVARVSHHPHWADFFRQSILWPLLVLTVTRLAHQESPGLPWLLGSCPSLVAEMTHIQLQHKVRGGLCHWGSIYWVLWGIRKNRWLLAGTERKGKGGMRNVPRAGCSAVALEVRAAFISKRSLPKKS